MTKQILQLSAFNNSVKTSISTLVQHEHIAKTVS